MKFVSDSYRRTNTNYKSDAQFYGGDRILKKLVSKNADVSRVDRVGRSPLDIAIWQGHAKCVHIISNAKNTQRAVDVSFELCDINHDCFRLEKKISSIRSHKSALHIASARLQVDCVRILLRAGYSPLLTNDENMTPLDVCGQAFLEDLASIAEQRFRETVSEFVTYAKKNQVENKIQNTMKTSGSREMLTTPLHVAVLLDSENSIQSLLDINAYPGCQDTDELTPFHLAVANKKHASLTALSSFVGRFETLEILNKYYETALHLAVRYQWIEGVLNLLKAGSNIMTTTGVKKNTVFHIAAKTGNVELLCVLIENISDKRKMLNCKNFQGFTPLLTAVYYCRIDFVKELLFRRVACNIIDVRKLSVFHIAAQKGNVEILSLLLSQPYKFSLINKHCLMGYTPLHFAAWYNHVDCVKVLCDAGANMQSEGKFKKTPLHLAAHAGNAEIVEFLLSKNWDLINKRNKFNLLPFHEAVIGGDKKCIDLFIKNGADFSEVIKYYNGKKEAVLATMVKNMHGSHDYLYRLFSSSIKKEGNFEPKNYTISIDYSILMPGRDKDMTKTRHETMQVTKALTTWKSLQRIYYFILITYGIFVVLLTRIVFTIYNNEQVTETPPSLLQILLQRFFLPLFIIVNTVQEIYIISDKLKYLWNYEVWVKLLSLVLAIAASFINHEVENPCLRFITAGAIVLAWLEMVILLSKCPPFGYFYQMFFTVAVRAIKILVLPGLFMIIGFSLAFWVSFNSKAPFDGPWKSFMKTIVMMTSDLDYSGVSGVEGWEHSSLFPQILFIFFLVFMSIVVMNLLLALAVTDVKELKVEGKFQRLVQQVDLLSTMDFLVSAEPWNYFYLFGQRMICEVPIKVWISPFEEKFSKSLTASIYQVARMENDAEKQREN